MKFGDLEGVPQPHVLGTYDHRGYYKHFLISGMTLQVVALDIPGGWGYDFWGALDITGRFVWDMWACSRW